MDLVDWGVAAGVGAQHGVVADARSPVDERQMLQLCALAHVQLHGRGGLYRAAEQWIRRHRPLDHSSLSAASANTARHTEA